MDIGKVERVGVREIPMPTFTPQEPQAPREPAPASPAPQRESEPRELEPVP
jgi:hypothetical protein